MALMPCKITLTYRKLGGVRPRVPRVRRMTSDSAFWSVPYTATLRQHDSPEGEIGPHFLVQVSIAASNQSFVVEAAKFLKPFKRGSMEHREFEEKAKHMEALKTNVVKYITHVAMPLRGDVELMQGYLITDTHTVKHPVPIKDEGLQQRFVQSSSVRIMPESQKLPIASGVILDDKAVDKATDSSAEQFTEDSVTEDESDENAQSKSGDDSDSDKKLAQFIKAIKKPLSKIKASCGPRSDAEPYYSGSSNSYDWLQCSDSSDFSGTSRPYSPDAATRGNGSKSHNFKKRLVKLLKFIPENIAAYRDDMREMDRQYKLIYDEENQKTNFAEMSSALLSGKDQKSNDNGWLNTLTVGQSATPFRFTSQMDERQMPSQDDGKKRNTTSIAVGMNAGIPFAAAYTNPHKTPKASQRENYSSKQSERELEKRYRNLFENPTARASGSKSTSRSKCMAT